MINLHLSVHPDIPLDKPEQFLHDLSEISNFAERISCFMFQADFDYSITTISRTLTNIKTTCDVSFRKLGVQTFNRNYFQFLIRSSALKEIFAIILTLGNYMNGGNMSRGQADGFGLEILSKLKDVKSKESHITLLHFIVKLYIKKLENPLLTNISLPVPEPDDIRGAAAVNFDDLQANLNKLAKELNGKDLL